MAMTMKSALRGTAIQARRMAFRAPRKPLSVCAFTDWKLEPEPAWCSQNKEKCQSLDRSYELCGVISEKMKQVMESSVPPEEQKRDDKAKFDFLCEQTGVKLAFESSGLSNPLDSPCTLALKDLGSNADVMVDGKRLERDVSTPLRPGSHVVLGDMHFQVVRDVHAHA